MSKREQQIHHVEAQQLFALSNTHEPLQGFSGVVILRMINVILITNE
jgi:hypothetical protein